MTYNKTSAYIASYLSGGTQAATKTDTKDDKAGKDGKPVLMHGDKDTRKTIHHVLKGVHSAIFNDHMQSYADVKAKHAAVVALAKPEGEDDDNDKGKDKK